MADIAAPGIHGQLVSWNGTLAPEVRNAWEELLAHRPDGIPAQGPSWWEFAHLLWPTRLRHLLLLRYAGTPLAVLPLVRCSHWTWAVPDDLMPDFPPLLMDAEREELAWFALADWLRDTPTVGELRLGRVNRPTTLTAFRLAARMAGVVGRQTPMLPAMEIDLGEDDAAFFTTLPSRAGNNIRHAETLLRREYPSTRMEIVTDCTAASEVLTTLIRLYQQRWHDQIGGCEFDDPGQAAWFTHGMCQAVTGGAGAIYTLLVDGQLVAVDTVLRQPGSDYAFAPFVARDAHALPSRYSPGKVLLLEVIRHLRAQGVRTLHVGTGQARYKQEYGGVIYPQWELSMARTPAIDTWLPPFERAVHLLYRLPVHLSYHAQQWARQTWPRRDA